MTSFDYQSALQYINGFDNPYQAALRDHGKQTWGLAKISELLEKLGNPHLAYPTIHVAGTKGKGSTSALIAQGLIESGLKTGLYISPHLEDWRERIQINRQLISEGDLASLVSDFEPFAEQVAGLTAFEVATALGFWHFARQRCDVAVIEVGLGGRLDATNVVQPLVAVLTNISLDHMQLLGNTIAEIASEKAAIIKPGVAVVSAPQTEEARQVIERQAQVARSNLVLVGRDWLVEPIHLTLHGSQIRAGAAGQMQMYHLRLPGRFQIENAAVALAALSEAERRGLPVTGDAQRAALANTVWPGRFELISEHPLIVLDSAHTPYSIEQMVSSLREMSDQSPITFVFGCMADKDIDGMLRVMLPVARRIIFTQAGNERAAAAQTLLEHAQTIAVPAGDLALAVAPAVANAVTMAINEASDGDVICILGSLSVAGQARSSLIQRRHAPALMAATTG